MPLVIINGWAVPKDVFNPLLSTHRHTDVIIINLCDLATDVEIDTDLSILLEALHRLLPEQPFMLSGWSYGGTVACAYAALYPALVTGLVTMATTPCFVQRADWSAGMDNIVFKQFLNSFRNQPKETLEQFKVLCSMGGRNKKRLVNALSSTVLNDPHTVDKLLSILEAIGTADIRGVIADIQCPVVHFYAQKDALVSVATADAMRQRYPDHDINIINGGHCFIMEDAAKEVASSLNSFCHPRNNNNTKSIHAGQLTASGFNYRLKKRIATRFSRAASTYDAAARLQNKVATHIMTFLPVDQFPDRILDLGSGTGCQTKQLAQRYPDSLVVATDLAVGMVKYAKTKHRGVGNSVWSVSDIENLSFQNNSFDIVYSNLSIQWCKLPTVIAQVKRIMKPGGRFIFSTLAEGTMPELRAAWQLVDKGIHSNYFSSFSEQKMLMEKESLLLHDLYCQNETLFYSDVFSLLRELKALGVNTVCSPNKGLMTLRKLEMLCHAYEGLRLEAGLPLSYNVIYGQIEIP